MTTLKETVELMASTEYKDQFIAEYIQLELRIKELSERVVKYKDGTLPKPACTYTMLHSQLRTMCRYSAILEERAVLENIDLIK